jgi:MYXO-CTERM domain-containing protein
LYLLDGAGNAFASAPFDPTSFGPSAQAHSARVLAAQLGGAPQPSYRIVAMLLGPNGNLYSMAQAVRGLGVTAEGATAQPGQRGSIGVVVRNLGSNLDGVTDAGLALPVHVAVTGLPGNQPFEADQTVEEGGAARIEVPFQGQAGSFNVQVNATSGELHGVATVLVRIEAPAKGLLPGFEGPLALAALAALALAQRRRTSR